MEMRTVGCLGSPMWKPYIATGIQQVLSTRSLLIGPSKLIPPSRLSHIYYSPRTRAQQTFTHLFAPHLTDQELSDPDGFKGTVAETDALAEWDYGLYEGLLTREIRAGRKERGLDGEREWDIWRDGCEGGEGPGEVQGRLDGLIGEIRSVQGGWMRGKREGGRGADVLLVCVVFSFIFYLKNFFYHAFDRLSRWEMAT